MLIVVIAAENIVVAAVVVIVELLHLLLRILDCFHLVSGSFFIPLRFFSCNTKSFLFMAWVWSPCITLKSFCIYTLHHNTEIY